MRLLIIDPLGQALDVAMRAKYDGHQVKHFIRQKRTTAHIGRGLVDVIEDFKPWARWADLILNTDCTLYLREIDALRKEGISVVSASQETAQWELDRQYGMKIFQQHDIPIPDSKEFHNYDDAIKYVKKEDRRFVSKPSGIIEDKSLSYVAKSPEDLVYMLERWKKLKKQQPIFILQECIEGIEMAVGGWFGPGGWSAGWCENWEFKKLMDGDLGPATGEQGSVLRYVRSSRLAREVLTPLSDTLSSLGYCGYIDANCIIDDNGQAWPLEFTMRFGWPTLNIQLALNLGDSIEWLLDLTRGIDQRNWWMEEIAIGVVLAIPDYPYSARPREEVIGIPIYGVKPALWKHIHPGEMMLANAPCELGNGDGLINMPMPCSAGDYILVMSATGMSVENARRRVYDRLKRLVVPASPFWRTDIGLRLSDQLPKLQGMGYAMGMNFATPENSSNERPSFRLNGSSRSSANPGLETTSATR